MDETLSEQERRASNERWLEDRLGNVTQTVRDLVAAAVLDGPYGLVSVTSYRIELTAHPAEGVELQLVIWLRETNTRRRGFHSLQVWQSRRTDNTRRADEAMHLIGVR